MSAFLTLLAALAALWVHGVFRALPRPGFRIALRAFAVGSLATAAALALASRNTLAPMRPLILGLGVAAALAAWTGLIRLVSFETRGRDLPGRWLCLGLAALSSALHGWPGLTASLAMSGTMVWRWKRELKTRARFTIGMIALALGLALVVHLGHRFEHGVLTAATEAQHDFARAVLITATFYALFGSLSLLRAWASDPSLGIRTVSRRLTLSHVLVGLVPLLLIVTLWTMTTVLGVLNERAIVGARAVEAISRSYQHQLEAALQRPAEVEARLAALPAAIDPALEIRVWRRAGGALGRVAGPAVPDEQRLGAWLDSMATLPARGVVGLGDTAFVGATARGPGGEAVLLSPMGPTLASLPGSVARASLGVWKRPFMRQQSDAGNSPADSLVDSLVAASGDEHVRGAGRDSATEAQVRRTLTRLGVPDSAIDIDTRERESPGIGISLDGQTLRIRQLAEGFLVQGHAIVHGIVWRDARWQQAMYLLTARAQPRTILYGLWNDVKTNELGVLPLMIVALFFAIAVMVFSWDLMMVRGMGRSITQAVGALRGAAERLRAGDLSHRIPIAGEDDLWQVAAAFNTATAGLARAREAEQEQQRIEDELEVARRIQARLLPAAVPRIAGLEIAGHYDPAREIGGDYYDHIALDAARVLVVIADVSGKSVPAALIMAGFRAALVSQDLATCSPPELATRLNGFLLDSLDPGKFVTAFLAVLDGASGRVVYVNAGHNPPVLLRASGAHEMLSAGGTILGIMPASRYERGETTLEPGDLMALYTDGVTEAANPAAEMWGDARLVDTLRSLATAPCEQLVRSIAHEVRAFEGEHGPTDDVTLIAVRRTTR